MDYINHLIQTPIKTILKPLNEFVGYQANENGDFKAALPAREVEIVASTMNSTIVRLAGLSGASAVILGAYGAHALKASTDLRRTKAFDTASRYHLLHSLALLGSGQARYPGLTAGLITGGILLFCGPCYHYSITGDEKLRKLTPVGGILFILGWLSFIL